MVEIGHRPIVDVPQTPWLVEGLLLYRAVTLLGGPGAAGKSVLALQIAISVALGVDFGWWHAPLRKRNVLVLSAEDDEDEVERRVAAACQLMKVDRADLPPSLLLAKQRAIRLVIKDLKTGKVTPATLWRQVAQMISENDIGLLIIDPLVKASEGFDESSNTDQDRLFEEIIALTGGHDCAILLVDHFAKAGIGGDQNAIRGASAKVNAARVACTLAPMTKQEWTRIKPPRAKEVYAKYSGPKMNYGPKIGDRWVELVVCDVGNGEKRVGAVPRNLGEFEDLLDPETWVHHDAFLRLVAEGRSDKQHKGWPWCTTTKGARDTRLDVAAAEAFDLAMKQAQKWITAFTDADLIMDEDWTSPTKNKSKVWAVVMSEEENAGEEEE